MGFGIRHALTSGYLAGRALIEGKTWSTIADTTIRPQVRASLVNRWVYERLPSWGQAGVVRYFANQADLNAVVKRWYHPRLIHRILWPLVARSVRAESYLNANPQRART